MKVLTYREAADWCVTRGYATRQLDGHIVGPDPDLRDGTFGLAKFNSPRHAGELVSVAQRLLSFIELSPEFLLWFGDWAVWPSSQHMPLFTTFRKGLGEGRHLIEAPAHLLLPEERDDAISMITVALLFSWDCHLLSASGRDAAYVSHDDWGYFASRDAPRMQSVMEEHSDFFGQRQEDEMPGTKAARTRFEHATPILNVANLARSVRYYVDILGFTNAEWSGDDFTCVTRDGAGIYLSEGDQGKPGTWVWLGVEDVEALHHEYRQSGATILQPPENLPWACEMQVRDPDGHVLRFGSDPKDDA